LVSLPASIGTIGPWFISPPPLAVALLLVLLLPLPSASLLLRGRLALLLLLLLLLLLHPLGRRDQLVKLAYDALLHASRGESCLALIEQLRAPPHVGERALEDVLWGCARERCVQVPCRGIAWFRTFDAQGVVKRWWCGIARWCNGGRWRRGRGWRH
jgi:hypothetical protein